MHEPVMVSRCVELFAPAMSRPQPVLVDATLGLGGHTRALLTAFPSATVVGIDRDPQARRLAAARLAEFGARCEVRAGEHVGINEVLADYEGRILGVLFDLGVSSMQLDEPERGFAYAHAGPLDMRMNPDDELSAWDVVNSYDEQELAHVLWKYGEEKSARRVARAIVGRRKVRTFEDTGDLAEVVRAAIPAPAKRTGGNPSKRTFQAIRIEVNGELAGLPVALEAAIDSLSVGGRIVVISYHSLEDRITKRTLRAASQDHTPPGLPVLPDDSRPALRLVTRGAEVPSEVEIRRNPRAASAKLRAAERVREAA